LGIPIAKDPLMVSSKVAITFFLLFLGARVLAQTPSADWREPDLERYLETTPAGSGERVMAGKILAEKYLGGEYLQEAIWTYRSVGLVDDALFLESKLAHILADEPMTLVEEYTGADRARKFQMGDRQIFGLFKSNNEFYGNEVLAYRLCSLLGLNVVPLTIFREHPIYGQGSLQVFITMAVRPAAIDNPYKISKGMWLLDYLLKNVDRDERNWLIRYGGKPVAIDHGHTMNRNNWSATARLKESFLPEGDLLERLKNLAIDDFKDLKIDVSSIFERRAEVLSAVAKKSANAIDPAPCSIMVAKAQ
jgi:hypothetical protein